jgi:competence protein ComEA
VTDLLQPDPPSGWRERVAAVRGSFPSGDSTPGLVGILAAAVVIAAVAVPVLLLLRSSTPAAELTLPRAEAPPSGSPTGPSPTAAVPGAPGGLATVHAAGQVANPGVYTVPAGARVADVLTAAGGPLADADLSQLNLAAKVADGERVWVPKPGEARPPGAVPAAGAGGGPSGGTAPAGPLDLNTATAEQLEELPGIGPATARAILTWRSRNGRFRTVADLLEVPGIGPAKLEAVRPLVRV